MPDWSEYFTVAGAADELGLSEGRVRGLIDSGVLSADKVAGRWLISPESVHARKNNQRRPGRPLNPGLLWGLISSGFIAQLLVASDAAARHNVRVQLANRAKVHDVYVLPQRVRKGIGPVIAPGGRALAESVDVPAERDPRWDVDAYADASAVAAMRRKKVISGVKGDPNVRLRVVDHVDMTWSDSRAGRLLVAWLDLADDGDRAADLAFAGLRDELRRADIEPFPVGNEIVARVSLGTLAALNDELVG
ncbi:MAG: helix-turn-helix domain-containing protein [Ilumatobacteraceae bacterium]